MESRHVITLFRCFETRLTLLEEKNSVTTWTIQVQCREVENIMARRLHLVGYIKLHVISSVPRAGNSKPAVMAHGYWVFFMWLQEPATFGEQDQVDPFLLVLIGYFVVMFQPACKIRRFGCCLRYTTFDKDMWPPSVAYPTKHIHYQRFRSPSFPGC